MAKKKGVPQMNTPRSAWPKNPYKKQYITVRVEFTDDGILFPRSLLWTDGQEYPIDRVKDICSAPALKAGGQGDRYTVMIRGRERYLFFEHNPDPCDARLGKWFVEVKNPDY